LEKVKASVLAKFEHPFQVIKRQFGHVKVRYRGLAKNTVQLKTLYACQTCGWPAKNASTG
jgi:IS5 family transposase